MAGVAGGIFELPCDDLSYNQQVVILEEASWFDRSPDRHWLPLVFPFAIDNDSITFVHVPQMHFSRKTYILVPYPLAIIPGLGVPPYSIAGRPDIL
jgi:hypothetical protein